MQYLMHGGLYDRIYYAEKAKELTGLAVAKLKTEGSYAVGGVDGLYLRVRGQSRSWVLCVAMGVRVNALGRTVPRRLNMGLGPYPEVSLAEARDKARELRKQIRNGIDPLAEKHAHKAHQERLAHKNKSFASCAEDVIAIKTKELKNQKHIAQWRSTLETYAYPVIGQKPIAEITKTDLLAILEPIWLTKTKLPAVCVVALKRSLITQKRKNTLRAITLLHGKVCLSPSCQCQAKFRPKNIMLHYPTARSARS